MTITYAVGQRLTAEVLQQLADYTVNRPLVRLVATSTQNISDNTGTTIQFGTASTVIDTHGFHSETVNNTRVTPTIAGYYRAWGTIAHGSRTDYATIQSSIRLNGVDQIGNTRLAPNSTSDSARSGSAEPITVLCNGTTDYIELGTIQNNTANVTQATTASGSTCSYFEVEFVRPA